jgi:hypothetical protein
MIKKSQLVEMFEGMREQAPWDVDSNLLWGYFFTGSDPSQLTSLADELVSLHYRFVEQRPDDKDSGYWLHMEKVETHSPDSLHLRNRELYRRAADHGVNYDGMDVGPAPE